MIIDRLQNFHKYLPLHPGFKEAFEFYHQHKGQLSFGTKEIIKDKLFVIFEKNTGKGVGGGKLETHRRFIDIQIVLSGTEFIGWSHLKDCHSSSLGYHPEKDIEFYQCRPSSWITMPAETFAIFFPQDGHAPLCGEGEVNKVIFKILEKFH